MLLHRHPFGWIDGGYALVWAVLACGNTGDGRRPTLSARVPGSVGRTAPPFVMHATESTLQSFWPSEAFWGLRPQLAYAPPTAIKPTLRSNDASQRGGSPLLLNKPARHGHSHLALAVNQGS